jgi:cytoskeletal protein RodZ/energy-coupling factor transporter ATP-binding protein EcfA2
MGESSLTNTGVLQRNPFPGIRSFTSAEDKFYFGRENAVSEVLELFRSNRFCALVGPSGSGKTSLIQSGIIPELITEKKEEWIPILVRPGMTPLENLVRGFQQVFPHHIMESDVETFLSGSMDLGDLIEGKDLEGNNFYLVVDQFEELFISWPTVRKKKKNGRHPEATRLVELLVRAIEAEKPAIYVTIALRSDFVEACSPYRSLTELMNRSKYLLAPMTREALSKAIMGPISLTGARVERGFEDYLLNDLEEAEVPLPMLQHALMRTWDYWSHHGYPDKPISISDYQSIGTLKNAIGDHLEEAYQELNQFQREICERLFKSITYKGEQNEVFRRQSALSTIARIAQCSQDELTEVVEIFRRQGRAFIAPQLPLALTPETLVELAHESLVELWPRLQEWVDEEADSIGMYLRLSEASALYQQGRTELWKPPELQQAIIWRNTQKPTPAWGVQYNPAFERAMVFLSTSEEEQVWEQERRIVLQRRRLIMNRAITVLLGLLVIVLALVYFTSRNSGDSENQSPAVAEQQPVYIPEDQPPAYSPAEEQSPSNPSVESLETEGTGLQENFQEPEPLSEEAAARPSGREEQPVQTPVRQERSPVPEAQRTNTPPVQVTVPTQPRQERANAQAAERARLEARQRDLAKAREVAVMSINIEKDPELQGLLAYQSYLIHTRNNGNRYDAAIYNGLYEATKKLISPAYNIYPNLRSSIKGIEWLRRSASMLTISSDGSIKILSGNIANRASQITLASTGLNNECLAVSPDERLAVVGTNGGGLLFLELENNGTVIHRDTELGEIVLFLANLGSTGSFVSAGTDNRIIKWEYEGYGNSILVTTGARPSALTASSDGRRVAYGTRDGKLFELDVNAPGQVRQVADYGSNHVRSLEYSPNGQLLIAGMLDGSIRVLSGAGRSTLAILRGPGSRVSDMAYSPDGRFLAAASHDGNVYLWSTSDWEAAPMVFSENNGFVLAVCFNGNSSYFYSGSVDYPRLVGRPSEAAQMAGDFCSLLGRNLTVAEWDQYFDGDIPYEKTCPGLNQ